MSPIWFVNYSPDSKIRVTEIRVCNKLKEAKQFVRENRGISGFLIRQDADGNSFRGFFGDFEPSAQQDQNLDNILKAKITW